MSTSEIIDLSSDDERFEEINVKPVKLEPGLISAALKQNSYPNIKSCIIGQNYEKNRNPNVLSTDLSTTSLLDETQSPANDLSSSSPICSAPLCRQFWKAGSYEDGPASKERTLKNSKNYLQIHPMFLHSNATSHKWAFGAIAELLDNAVDEIQNGATFVKVDKVTNPRDGSPALLIQDDGGGMDPEAIRRCMSFGFSDKKDKSTIGQYGNGFKTSSMRLGADVIVFSRHLNKRTVTQSIGLLSYTFLTRTGHDRIVVPMVDYEFNASTQAFKPLCPHGKEHYMSNLSVILQWSPYSKESELLKQFEDIGYHGTKVVVYNLWINDDGNTELDFDTDQEDIRIGGYEKKTYTQRTWKELNEQHIGHRYSFSLRVYLSILYLRIPDTFRIVLRGCDVEHHSIVNDLKFKEVIMYRPHSGGSVEGEIVTTVGFLNDAPHVNIHGFNVYHKNRLILPFWQVVTYQDSRGRGVVGILETNFIQPTHNKQDFERTSLFQKLESRLKEMTWEYWDYHCALLGYTHGKTKEPTKSAKKQPLSHGKSSHNYRPVILGKGSAPAGPSISNYQRGVPVPVTRTEHDHLLEQGNAKRQTIVVSNVMTTPQSWELRHANTASQVGNQEAINLMQENRKLHAQCSEHEKRKQELTNKVTKLRTELVEVQKKYAQMLVDSRSLGVIKLENNNIIT